MKRFLLLSLLVISTFAVTYTATRLLSAPPAPAGMVWLPGGEFTMGTNSNLGWPDEKPAHRVRVSGFFIDATEVTNAEFQRFVDATKYVTTAEKAPDVE